MMTIEMGLGEEYFWKSTPRKINALIDQKNKMKKVEQKNLAIYICSFLRGQDPDPEQEEQTLMPGRDIPIDPLKLKGLMM